MRLTWKDGVATVLLGVVIALATAATQGWGWPLMGSYRSAGLVVFGVGIAMCALSGSAQSTTSAPKSPYVVLASALGIVALVMLAGVLITGGEAWFVALVVGISVLWAMTTFRHSVQGWAARPMGGTAEVR